ncbi:MULTISPECIES: tetratricopeptide repeat protein [unclassified Streptomyces]|uniref:tetratricopeptide repeat protein n=1 Tax=unclassified Streptomyces TaxID=2593676 RepID=UPI0022533993|nr:MULTISPECIES: tetratricopeptide repeat protein [unclassified Streptomyces]MCX5140555.1 tetratricopeptide repeat protein [Streptomyces sp. NBC_00338]WSU59090.1 tetratricopeptide repeat protein [Streptomyces sp. NBC_01104]
MDVTPQQPPADRPVPGPDHSADTAYAPPCESPPALPPDAASLAEPPPASLRTTLRRAAFGVVAGAVLVTGAVVAVPDGDEDAAPPVPGPVSRAMAATAAGSPASLSDLTALIGDRQKWVGTHPSDARSWAVLGSAYVEWGRRASDAAYYTRAEQALKRSLNVEPGERGNEAAWVGLASLANARHDFVTAKKWGETVRSRQPKQWTVYPELVDAYNGLGDYKSATTAVEKYAALRSGVPALGMTADMYRDRGWREDALATAQDAVNRAKTPAEKAACLSRLGELAWERGEPQEAVAQYGAALRTDPAHHPSLAGRARALAALGRTDEAQRDYQAALTKSPRPAYMLELGELYESLGLDGDSVNQYTQLRRALARTKAQGVDDSLLLGRFEAAHGDANAAVELLRAEWGRGHHSAAVADALGWALHRSGDPDSALEYAEQAVDSGGQNAGYAYHLGMVQRALQDFGPARRHLEEALRTNPQFSPLDAPRAQEALDTMGLPPAGGPQDMQPAAPPAPQPPQEPSPAPEPESGPAEPAAPPGEPGDAPAPAAGPPGQKAKPAAPKAAPEKAGGATHTPTRTPPKPPAPHASPGH